MSLPTDTRGDAIGAETLKIEAGQTEVLIVGPAVTGYEYWKEKGGPVRQVEVFNEPLPEDARMVDVKDKDGNVTGRAQDKQKFFWAMPVYNFKTSKFEILQIPQKGLRDDLLALQKNESWGDPTGRYTITIDKSGTGYGTKYHATGNPDSFVNEAKKTLIAELMAKYLEDPIDVSVDLFGTKA